MNKLNIADWITISRLVLIPVVITTTLFNLQFITACLLTFAFLTDAIDGFIARHFNMASERGARLDSIADASLFVAATFCFVYFLTEFVSDHIYTIGTALGLYFIQLLLAFIKYGRPSSFHTYLAKSAAVLQGTFFLVALFYEPVLWFFYTAIIISILETIEEIILIFILPDWKSDVKGIYWVLKQKVSQE